jgi:4-carboxymuconolactone decarboxylase
LTTENPEKTKSAASVEAINAVAPALGRISKDVLFGEVWERPGLSKRDRSLITVAALVAMNRTDQMPGHMNRALDNGVTREELGELITHMAFYSGWPTAASASMVAHEILKNR